MADNPGAPAADFEVLDRDPPRFWEKVDRGEPDECWEWQSVKQEEGGYGRFRVRGSYVNSHRFAYKMEKGEIGDHLVLHKCDNRECVNPRHLELGDQSENMKQAYNRGRIDLPDNSGENNGNAKLTDSDVAEIKRLMLTTSMSDEEIAERYPVSVVSIKGIRAGRTWTHVNLAGEGGEGRV